MIGRFVADKEWVRDDSQAGGAIAMTFGKAGGDNAAARRIAAALNLVALMPTDEVEKLAQPSPVPFMVLSFELYDEMRKALQMISDKAPSDQPADSQFDGGDRDPDLHAANAWWSAAELARPVLERLRSEIPW